MIQDAQNILRTTLSESAAFQAFVEAGDATAALARIHHDALTPPNGDRYTVAELASLRPCALIWTESFTHDKDAMGLDECWNSSGSFKCVLYRTVPSAIANDPSQVDTTFRVIAGNILEDLAGMSETGGRLAIRGMQANGPYRTPPQELKQHGDEQAYELIIDWGLR